MLERLDDYDWENAFTYAEGFSREDVGEIIAIDDGEYYGDNWIGVFRLRDGRYAYLSVGCDYTGWDCQAGGDSHICDGLDPLLLGFVGEQECKRLGIKDRFEQAIADMKGATNE